MSKNVQRYTARFVKLQHEEDDHPTGYDLTLDNYDSNNNLHLHNLSQSLFSLSILEGYLTKIESIIPSIGELKFYCIHTIKESNRRTCNFCLSICSCIIAVIVSSLSYTIIDNAPVVFLKQAEVEYRWRL